MNPSSGPVNTGVREGDKSAGVPIRPGLSCVQRVSKQSQAIGESMCWQLVDPLLASSPVGGLADPNFRASPLGDLGEVTMGQCHGLASTPVVSCRIVSVLQRSGELNQRGVSVSGEKLSTTVSCLLHVVPFREHANTRTSRFLGLRAQIQIQEQIEHNCSYWIQFGRLSIILSIDIRMSTPYIELNYRIALS